jgi:Holliday junction resolvase
MARYHKGRRLEYRVKKLFEKNGYFVIRSSGSHTPVDIVAINKDEIVLIQCCTKKDRRRKARELSQVVSPKCVRKVVFYLDKHNKRSVMLSEQVD